MSVWSGRRETAPRPESGRGLEEEVAGEGVVERSPGLGEESHGLEGALRKSRGEEQRAARGGRGAGWA